MLRTVSTLTLGLLVLTACPGDDTGTTAADSGPGPGTTTEDPTGTNPPGTTTESADTTAGTTTVEPPGTTTEEPGDTTETPGETTETAGETTDGTTGNMGGACEPDPADDKCAACVKENCCDELEACQGDAGCVCFQDCAAMNPGLAGAMQCAEDCMVDPFGGVQGPLTNCTIGSCGVCLG